MPAPTPVEDVRRLVPALVHVRGALLIWNREAFKLKVLDALMDGSREVVIDLRDCDHIDAAGLGALVSLHKRAGRTFAAMLWLENVSEMVVALLEVTRLDTLLNIRNSDESFLAKAARETGSRPAAEAAILRGELGERGRVALSPVVP